MLNAAPSLDMMQLVAPMIPPGVDTSRLPSGDEAARARMAQAALPWFMDFRRRWMEQAEAVLADDQTDKEGAWNVSLQAKVVKDIGCRLQSDIRRGTLKDIQENIPVSRSEYEQAELYGQMER